MDRGCRFLLLAIPLTVARPDSSTHALLDHQADSHLSSLARKRHAHHSLGRMGHLAAQFASRGRRIFRIRSAHEPVCPYPGHGGSRGAPSPHKVKDTLLSPQTPPNPRPPTRPLPTHPPTFHNTP